MARWRTLNRRKARRVRAQHDLQRAMRYIESGLFERDVKSAFEKMVAALAETSQTLGQLLRGRTGTEYASGPTALPDTFLPIGKEATRRQFDPLTQAILLVEDRRLELMRAGQRFSTSPGLRKLRGVLNYLEARYDVEEMWWPDVIGE